jgi:hypothetical protein
VTIRHPNGETLDVVKESRDQANFTVLDIPAGRELKSEGVANTLASALSSLGLEDVTPVTDMNPAEREGPTVEYRTFDGLVIAAKAFEADDAYLVHFGVSSDEAQALSFAESGGEEPAEGSTAGTAPSGTEMPEPVASETESVSETPTEPAESAAESDQPDFEATRQEAEQLNARLEPWVFTITNFKHENMTKGMEELLAPAEDKEAEAQKPDVPPMSEVPEVPPESETESLPTSTPPASTDESETEGNE